MKKLFLLTCSVILTTGMLFAQKTEKRTVSNFSGIKARSIFDITVKKGDVTSVVITADENVLPFVITEVNNGILKLSVKNYQKNIKVLKANITVQQLSDIELSGACKLVCEDLLTGRELDIYLSGASYIKLSFSGDKLKFYGAGASKLEIDAMVKKLSSEVFGSSNVILHIPDVQVAEFEASGASKQVITGKAETAKFEISGVARITAKTLTVNRAQIDASGASSLNDIEVTDKLEVTAWGTSKVSYKGNPRTQLNRSGASSIKSKK
ncbi:MAG: DUF2807 domain-containing protein [Bacteroidales bacterium]|jgi:hypothetical protein|nr:DUF2807 domain-containing protein [Bacteroidales bacterium]